MELKYNNQLVKIKEGTTGFDLLKILNVENKGNVLVYKLGGTLYDLATPLPSGGNFSFVTKDDDEAFALLNHDAAHLMAQAILSLYPHAKFGIGPDISEGFYYDIDFGDAVINDSDLPIIEQRMLELSKQDFRIERQVISKEKALELFTKNEYKIELIKEIEERITIYKQGDFLDLCYGPHLPSTRYVQHFKLLSLAGAYWRGDSSRKQLTRIYGVAFFSKEALDKHLHNLEEAKKRDHRKLGRELGLFMISEYGPGFPFWLQKGMVLYHELEHWWIKKQRESGYEFVKTPLILSRDLWERSGHWANYRENMYTTLIDERDFAIKPMNCPGAILIYNNTLHSYKDLPIRVAEHGNVHRHEPSGSLTGLFRVRNFTQDDAHIFCRKDQLQSEIKRLLKLYDDVYKTFNLSYHIELSTRPAKKYIGDIKTWNFSEKALAKACKASGIPFKINEGDGAFYGPKLDFKLRDSLGRIWQCGTIQLDMNLPERFDISYIDSNNQKIRPIMLHRAVFGSIERFIGILIEHYAGAFPLWLSPIQVAILPVNNEAHLKHAQSVARKFMRHGIRITLDDSNEKLSYRLRQSQVAKIPYTLVIGDREKKDNLVTYRKFGDSAQVTIPYADFMHRIKQEIKDKA
ncbi:MAG: Threonine--tRNA ligase 2 [Tenericutes bacterium ADurb.Bin239]|nr:MAG: Threonine--tRNA ligase 2 [Tenericutes bacterium ADurb.Bin239]